MNCAEIPCKLSYLFSASNKQKKKEIEKMFSMPVLKKWKIMQNQQKESLHRQRKRLENDGK